MLLRKEGTRGDATHADPGGSSSASSAIAIATATSFAFAAILLLSSRRALPGRECMMWRIDRCIARGITRLVVVALVRIGFVRVHGRNAAAQDVFAPQEAVGDILIQLIPLLDPTPFFKVIVVDMIESLIPGFTSLFGQLHDSLAKPAPKSRLPVPSDLMSLELLPDIIFILDRMSLLEMGLE